MNPFNIPISFTFSIELISDCIEWRALIFHSFSKQSKFNPCHLRCELCVDGKCLTIKLSNCYAASEVV